MTEHNLVSDENDKSNLKSTLRACSLRNAASCLCELDLAARCHVQRGSLADSQLRLYYFVSVRMINNFWRHYVQ